MAANTSVRPTGWLVWILGAIVVVVASIALRNAVAWYGRPIAGVLVDPGGSVSGLGLSHWDGKKLGLEFPQSIAPVGAPPLRGSRERTTAWDGAVASATARGEIVARVEGGAEPRTVTLRVHPLEPAAWWVYGFSSIVAGLLYAGSGLLALWASPRGRLARTFAIFGVNIGLFLISLFDIHTQRSLTYVFFFCFAIAPVNLVMLGLRLPDDVVLLRRFPKLEWVAYCGGAALGLCVAAIHFTGGDSRPLQALVSALFGASLMVFVVVLVVRYAYARGERQDTLRPLLLAMVPVYAGFGVLLLLNSQGLLKGIADMILYPALLFAPLATLYAFVRHDLWGSRALLSRVGTHLALGGMACVAAIAASAALASSVGLSFRDSLAGAAVSTLFVLTLSALAQRISDSTLFRSRAEYKPTIEQLSTELLTITSPDDVARAIERTVQRWLPCDLVRLTLSDGAAASDAKPASPRPEADDIAVEQHLPVTFATRDLAWLDVGQKRGGALFTNDDLDLLRTIANQGALAIAHAQAYQELEQRRRQQAQAWRGEREALVETVAAEIAHEIRYPINYFRSVFERSAQGEVLDTDDVEVGREEVDRLERLVSGLRRMAGHRVERVPVAVAELCGRAEALLRDALGQRHLSIDVAAEAVVRCDADKMLQVLVNLFSNGLEAAGVDGHVGVTWSEHKQYVELVVWDDGPGFVGEPARLFAPWFTTKPRGTGLGLAIAHRLVRAHGWNITAQRREDRTAFVVTIRKEDVVQAGSLASPTSMREVEVA